MKLSSFFSTLALASITLCCNAALYVHDTPKELSRGNSSHQVEGNRPELDSSNGRGRGQLLNEAIKSIVKNKMDVVFVSPQLKELKVNWRSLNEPIQIVLTKLSRGYHIDITVDENKETLYVDVDTGQCDAVREAKLLSTKKMFVSLGIHDEPTLPPRLAKLTDYSGSVYRLC